MRLFIYIILMAGVTYLIRMLPFTFFTRKIKSTFFKSFLYYVPYAVLSAMTFPYIFESTGDVFSAMFGTAAALILGFFRMPLIVVALAAALVAFGTSFFTM